MLERLIEKAVARELDRRVVARDNRVYPTGYNPLPVIMGAMFEWLYVPFNGQRVLVKVRYPNYTQLSAAGYDYGQILLDSQKERTLTEEERTRILNAEEYAAKCVMCSPTYEDFEKLVYGEDHAVVRRRAKMAELRDMLASPQLTQAQRKEFTRELAEADRFTGILLPDDTMAALVRVALGADVSDLRSVTKKTLEQAAYKSEIYGGAPHTWLSGVFTDRDAAEIDAVCFGIIADLKEDKRRNGKPPKKNPKA